MNYSRKEKNSGNTVFQNQVGKFSEIRVINKNLTTDPTLCSSRSLLFLPAFARLSCVSEIFWLRGTVCDCGEGERDSLCSSRVSVAD